MALKKRGPGSLSALIIGILSLLAGGFVGMLIAATYLVFVPVHEVKRMPAEDDIKPGIYYVEGRRSGIDGAEWVGKRNQLIAEAPFEFTLREEELNQWSSSSYGEMRKNLKIEYGNTKLEPGIPMFRIDEGLVQVGVTIELNGIGDNLRVILQASGDFVKGPDQAFVFQADTVYLGSCRIPHFQGISSLVTGGLSRVMGVPEDIATAWPTLSRVSIEGGTLTLARQ